ncbi:15010_t:CDS:1, partial [Gigaspora margarita]
LSLVLDSLLLIYFETNMLHEGINFSNWNIALETISTFAKQNEFTIKKEHIEYCSDST